MDIDKQDGYVTLMNDDGDTRSDLKLPEDADLRAQILAEFAEGKELILTVLKAVGTEQIIQSRVNQS